jgi:hypothetical protein
MADEIIAYSLANHPAPHRNRVGLAMLLYGLFAAPIVWAGDLMIDFALVGHACFPGETPLTQPQAPSVKTIVLLCHLAALLLIASGTGVSYLMWRVTGPPEGHQHHLIERGEGRTRYLGIVGMGFGAMFFLIALAETLSLAFVSLCSS